MRADQVGVGQVQPRGLHLPGDHQVGAVEVVGVVGVAAGAVRDDDRLLPGAARAPGALGVVRGGRGHVAHRHCVEAGDVDAELHRRRAEQQREGPGAEPGLPVLPVQGAGPARCAPARGARAGSPASSRYRSRKNGTTRGASSASKRAADRIGSTLLPLAGEQRQGEPAFNRHPVTPRSRTWVTSPCFARTAIRDAITSSPSAVFSFSPNRAGSRSHRPNAPRAVRLVTKRAAPGDFVPRITVPNSGSGSPSGSSQTPVRLSRDSRRKRSNDSGLSASASMPGRGGTHQGRPG